MSHNAIQINNISADVNGDFSLLSNVTTDNTQADASISTYTGIEEIYLVDNQSANVTITIPTGATAGTGYKYQIKRLGTGSVTIAPVSGTIDTVSSFSIGARFDSVTLVSDGQNWFLI